ncbi:hypothetical protein EGR_09428 [Echinococcus granulosus]|uniref:Uncharacterized protein n=1 Tax=Echinococcus granulosus TaxID=6210 RepID=W6U3M7_ECHGR|nr:hypothetical protein EGR_09428 [Echinococcus granulosus]EUB55715.1 hypothetical protein EGR_09428 [Echinococcus granulosus]
MKLCITSPGLLVLDPVFILVFNHPVPAHSHSPSLPPLLTFIRPTEFDDVADQCALLSIAEIMLNGAVAVSEKSPIHICHLTGDALVQLHEGGVPGKTDGFGALHQSNFHSIMPLVHNRLYCSRYQKNCSIGTTHSVLIPCCINLMHNTNATQCTQSQNPKSFNLRHNAFCLHCVSRVYQLDNNMNSH